MYRIASRGALVLQDDPPRVIKPQEFDWRFHERTAHPLRGFGPRAMS